MCDRLVAAGYRSGVSGLLRAWRWSSTLCAVCSSVFSDSASASETGASNHFGTSAPPSYWTNRRPARRGSVAIRISSRSRTLSGVCLRHWATTGSVSILSNCLIAKEPERVRGCAVQLEVGGVVLVVRARTARVCCVPRCERDHDMGGCHRGVARGGGAGSRKLSQPAFDTSDKSDA